MKRIGVLTDTFREIIEIKKDIKTKNERCKTFDDIIQVLLSVRRQVKAKNIKKIEIYEP